ncbi:hypothetical protein BV898_12796 [Hypsibius exemplaris]|uniref:Uncharacterized protein n=1 Tax=Hypsibius exemplaris TaxID=2072580 RepID=A0A1W0WCN6_HYPEX|nr:hypothetical protein BV898_12796 [Hypsibius exemplaris]
MSSLLLQPPFWKLREESLPMRKAMDTGLVEGPLGIVIKNEPRPSKTTVVERSGEKRCTRSSSTDRLAVREEKPAAGRRFARGTALRTCSSRNRSVRPQALTAKNGHPCLPITRKAPRPGAADARNVSPMLVSPLIGAGKTDDVPGNRNRDDRPVDSRSRDDRDYRRRSSPSRSPVRTLIPPP